MKVRCEQRLGLPELTVCLWRVGFHGGSQGTPHKGKRETRLHWVMLRVFNGTLR